MISLGNVRLLSFFLALTVMAGCSAATSPVVSQVDNSIQLRSLNWPGDTVWVRSSEVSPEMDVEATVSGVATNGVDVVYLDPVRHVNYKAETYDSGLAKIALPASETLPHRDTSFVVDYQGMYGGRTSPVMRKVIECVFGTEAPTELWLRSIDESSIAVRWDRASNDHYTDTLVAVDTNGVTQRNLITAGNSASTLTGLHLGMPYTITLHTRGGSTTPFKWATVMRSGVIRLHSMATANGSEYVGIAFSGMTLRPVTPSDFDSASIVLANVPGNGNTRGGRNLLMGFNIRYGFPRYTGSAQVAGFNNFSNQTIDQTYYAADSVIYLYYHPTSYGLYLDTTASAPVTSSGAFTSNVTNHFVLLQVDPQPNGQLVGQDADGDFVDIEVVYQPTLIAALKPAGKHDHE